MKQTGICTVSLQSAVRDHHRRLLDCVCRPGRNEAKQPKQSR